MKKFILFILPLLMCHMLLAAPSQNAHTRYPIVLIHGLFGYGNESSLLGRYWGDIPKLLKNHGATVYIAEVSQAHEIEKRGEQLYQQLQKWGSRQYNLIGHSQGGLDARYVLANYPEMVASVTTIGTPHHGSKVADYLVYHIAHQTLVGVFSHMFGNFLSHLIGTLSGQMHEQNVVRALNGLTTNALKEFNARYPTGVSKDYCESGEPEYQGRGLYSWGSFGIRSQSPFDWVSSVLTGFSSIFDKDEKNDGLVPLCSMKFGKWLGARSGSHHLIPVGGIVSPMSDEDRAWVLNMFLNHAYVLKIKGF